MPRRPLERDLARIAAKRARAAADVAEFDRQLAVLQRAQAELIEAVVEENQLHEEHSRNILPPMQEHSSPSRGVRIASGRDGLTDSRKAQLAVNLTDKQVAKMLKVSRSTVCKWHLGTLHISDEAKDALEKRGIPRKVWGRKGTP